MSSADGIVCNGENEGDGARLLKDRSRGGCGWRKNDIGLQRDEFLRESLDRLDVRCPANLDPDVSAFRPSQFLKFLLKSFDTLLPIGVVRAREHEHADPPHPLGCCARAVSGHAAAPPRRMMTSRRFR